MKGCRLLLLFVIILLFGQLQTFAQNNAFKINDTLYEYFRKAQNNLKVPGKGLRMADTLYVNAQKLNDAKAQALALYLRVSYYHNQENRDGERREFERISPILLKSPYLQYYFGAWMIIIIDHINNREYPQALIELGKFYDKAKELKSSYGILESYIIQGDLFFQRALFRLALPQYNKALKYAKENNLTDISTLYRRIGECCFSLQRWHDAEIAIQKGMEAYPDQQHSMTYLMLLLQTYCCMDTIVPSKIEQTYNKLQSLMARYPLINNYRVFYYRTMYYYHEYYTKDRAQALHYVQQGQKNFLPDSLIYYWKKGKEYDSAGNIREAAKCYRNYIHQAQIVREDEDKFLISSFVPQLDYQKVLHERELLSQKTTLMRLKRMKDSEQLMSLNEERDRLTLLDREKEHTILQNRLLVQKMLLKKQNQRLINQRIYNAQQKKTEQLRQNQFRWRVALNLFILVLLLIGLSVYLLRKYHTRKTLRLEKEKAEKAKQMKSLFFQNMNHEIRSPLNAIIGFNDVLNGSMAEDLPAEQKAEFVKMISTNCLLLQTLVNDVLDLSNFESGSYKLSPVDVDINHLCRTALESIRGRENDGVELIFKPSPDGVFILRTDAQRLQQVLTNYLSNACKYTEKGSITLSYDVLGDMVRFAVTDTGVGVRSEDAEKVFERFQMLDKSKRGTGLGLHICRLISKLLHGKVYLDTSYKGGSRFVFEHPLKALLTLIIALFVQCYAHESAEQSGRYAR
jgi:signal transduction histidine kinase